MKSSAGLLLYRLQNGLEIFLVHPGGPFWKNKHSGAWTIPKGEINPNESPLTRAKVEFQEETGHKIDGDFLPLAPITQKAGKTVHAWAIQADIDPGTLKSNFVDIQWPPRSGKTLKIPEIDQGAWFHPSEARKRINPAQVALVDELEHLLQSQKDKK